MSFKFSIPRTLFLATIAFGIGFASPSAMAAKVEICHKDKKTVRVSERALPAHKEHGDFLGKCDEVRSEALFVSCALVPPSHDVTAVSGSLLITTELDQAALLTANCAEALQAVALAGCDSQDVFGTPEAQTYTFACPSADAVIPDDPSPL